MDGWSTTESHFQNTYSHVSAIEHPCTPRKLSSPAMPSSSDLDSDASFEERQDFDDRIIDVNERRVWLLKVPNFLYESWNEISAPNTDLGKVIVESNDSTGDAPLISMILNEADPSRSLPKKYRLNFMKNPQTRFVFAENEQGKAVSIAGTIQYEFHVSPEFDDDYRRIMKERNMALSKDRKSVCFIDESKASTKFNVIAPVREFDLLQRKKRRLSPDSRRERLPKPEMMDLLFRAFERESHLSLRSLADYSNQPMIYLREVLGEIADFNKRGPFKGLFQLKPQFRRA